ncbi:hypothetical protein [Sutterella sp.]|uniref:hypothetical protein n=1 Tax=Sutterella sp. TaxID=1981025 RepID=UPI0026E07129|nr:hypothetical protein [Sutterella sp.]MDO5531450.1 hypothetical protein [Sutterella sp.]
MTDATDPTTRALLEFPEIQALRRVLTEIAPQGEISIAYSGGLDSRFLAFTSRKLGFNPTLLHIVGPQIAEDETSGALKDARELGIEPLIVRAEDLSLEELAAAGNKRCYVCKHHLFRTLMAVARNAGHTGPVCDGTNTSDLGVYRPGVKALEELKVFSPLALAGISKPRIREIGRAVGFPNPEQSARPCLLTRFPYGAVPTADQLTAIAEAELLVAEDPFGQHLRMRIRMPHPGDTQLHVEAAGFLALPDHDKELERIVATLKEKYGDRLPGLRAEVMEKLSGYYDRIEIRKA